MGHKAAVVAALETPGLAIYRIALSAGTKLVQVVVQRGMHGVEEEVVVMGLVFLILGLWLLKTASSAKTFAVRE